ncbi:MAG: 50S ribosomal protein L21 [Defluviitaleaceae bacterium]|nr:50S ribosomal protein L21 [Defluviitaleaceae bacterium]
MYAIIETGGKQYKVKEGDIITVEKLNVDAGANYIFDKVLSVLNGDESTFGTPYLDGASVGASVIGDGKGKKVVVYKYKSKKNYHCKKGHRQPFTKLKIESITGA